MFISDAGSSSSRDTSVPGGKLPRHSCVPRPCIPQQFLRASFGRGGPGAFPFRPPVPAWVLAKASASGCWLPRSFMRPSQYRKRGELRHKKREFFIKTFFKSHNFLIKRKYGKTPASGWASNLFLHQCRMQNWNWVQEFFWLWQLLLNGQVCITAGYGGGMMMAAEWLGGGRHGRNGRNGTCGSAGSTSGSADGRLVRFGPDAFLAAAWREKPR